MKLQRLIVTKGPPLSLITAAFISLYFIQLQNYLLFHSIAELFSIVIAFCIFLIAWNGKSYLANSYLLFIGIAYSFVGSIDLLHTLGYRGMNIFTGYDYYANQLWIAGRGIEVFSLLIGLSIAGRKIKVSLAKVMLIYAIITALIIYSIFFSDIFPECFIEGEGQTAFKVAAEYFINIILLTAIIITFKRRSVFNRDIFRYIIVSLIFTIISELAFTFYISNYGFSNMLGHYAKIISFYYVYKAIVQKSIKDPNESIFLELNKQREQLERANKTKLNLFSIISHDLRSPFSGIRGTVDILRKKGDQLSSEERKKMLAILGKSVEDTSLLIENLLSWSRIEIEGYKIEMEDHELEPLLSKAAAPLRHSYSLKDIGISVKVDAPLVVRVNEDSLSIVIRNLLSNALKFSKRGTVVTLTGKKDGDEALITVADEGLGMDFDPENLGSEVNQSTSGTENEKGAGLGLFMIKKYTEENGGSLSITSKPGKGTTVKLRFPLMKKDGPLGPPIIKKGNL